MIVCFTRSSLAGSCLCCSEFSYLLFSTRLANAFFPLLSFYCCLQQAQTYFAGQSRYVGVYDTSRLAARAYVVVQEYLRKYRENRTANKETPKEELAKIFASARKAADDAVQEMRKEDAAATARAQAAGGGGGDGEGGAAAAAVVPAGPRTEV